MKQWESEKDMEKDPGIVSAGRATKESSWFSVLSVVNGFMDSAWSGKANRG